MATLHENSLIESIRIYGERPLSAEKIGALLRLAKTIGVDFELETAEMPPDFIGASEQDLVDYSLSQPAPPNHRRDTRGDDGGQCFVGLVRLNEYTDRHAPPSGKMPPPLRIAMTDAMDPIVDMNSVVRRLDFTNDDPKAWHGFYPRHLKLLRSYAEVRIAESKAPRESRISSATRMKGVHMGPRPL